jgi:hypothetical protein
VVVRLGGEPRDPATELVRLPAWNVFAKDYSLEEWAAPEFVTLNHLTYRLKQDLPRNRSLAIAHVNPSDIDEIRADCTQQEIETVLGPVR